ncbi:MAG: GntR family transcriptional regulator [Lachnospiraceae bacterium]|nr:GntR family transcriptional regulator [Lachnospiraceae bacterium]
MKIVIRPQGTMAIYEQIVSQIRQEIAGGELTEGTALPSIRALAAELEVSVITTKRAYEELEKEGLIRSVAGKGFYVCAFNQEYVREKQLMEIEKRMSELVSECKQCKMTLEDMKKMLEAFYLEE